MTGSATWTINQANTLTVVGGGNFDQRASQDTAIDDAVLSRTTATIVNLIYTYNAAPWTITPYFQYTHIGTARPTPGFDQGRVDLGRRGAGQLLRSTTTWNLAGRFEYISSSGSATAAP